MGSRQRLGMISAFCSVEVFLQNILLDRVETTPDI